MGSESGRPGRMTAAMRSIPAVTGPQVLRIGLVLEGKVVEERVVDRRSHVTIGPNETSMFVVANDSVPPNFRLFEVIGDEYHLNFLEGMSGRVALHSGISDLAELRGQAKRSADGAYRLRVPEDARGKVIVGETTFLFQLFDPPAIQPKPQLPVSVKGGPLDRIDWSVTIIAAFSFLAHFGAVGAMYSDWMDSVIDDELDVAGLIDSVKSLPVPAIEQPVDAATAAPGTPTAEVPKAPGAPSNKNEGPSRNRSMSPGERASLSAQLDQLAMKNVGALTGGPATDNVLRDASVPTDSLDEVAKSGAGVSPGGTRGLEMGHGGGDVIVPGAGVKGFETFGKTTGTTRGAGNNIDVKPPPGTATVASPEVRGHVIDAERVVAQLRAGFRVCYNQGLASNPTLHGAVKITAKVGSNGEVASATATGGEGLGDEVVSCLVRRVRGAIFSPPEGGGASIVIPITFALQK
jgi:hypothetical protein